jgi:ABC-type glycerol-3-phosphate transport system substrate-binding protein
LNLYRPLAAATVLGAFAISSVMQHPARAVAEDETITIASVNNPQMIDMQHAVGDFTKKTGIKVTFVILPENTLRQKVTADVATGGSSTSQRSARTKFRTSRRISGSIISNRIFRR